jgi:hypothetical protein
MGRVTKSIRWDGEEWAVVEAAALVAGVPAATWVREIAVRVARAGMAGVRAREGLEGPVGNVGAPAARGDLGVRAGQAGLRPVADIAREFFVGGRPAWSAGSAGSVEPPAAERPAGAGSVPSSDPAPGCVAAVDAVVAHLTDRFGRRVDHEATARRMLEQGRVRVDGVWVRPGDSVPADAGVVIS